MLRYWGGVTTRVVERVAKKVGKRIRQRCPSVPQPRYVLTDAAFESRSSCMAWMVAYVGSPSIGGMVGFSKLYTGLSTERAAMVGVKN